MRTAPGPGKKTPAAKGSGSIGIGMKKEIVLAS